MRLCALGRGKHRTAVHSAGTVLALPGATAAAAVPCGGVAPPLAGLRTTPPALQCLLRCAFFLWKRPAVLFLQRASSHSCALARPGAPLCKRCPRVAQAPCHGRRPAWRTGFQPAGRAPCSLGALRLPWHGPGFHLAPTCCPEGAGAGLCMGRSLVCRSTERLLGCTAGTGPATAAIAISALPWVNQTQTGTRIAGVRRRMAAPLFDANTCQPCRLQQSADQTRLT